MNERELDLLRRLLARVERLERRLSVVDATEYGGGASTFLGLTDTPSSYSGAGGDVVVVNSGESALEAETPVATSAGAGDAGKLVRLDAGGQVDATMINDADINLDNVTEGVTNKFFTATDETKLDGIAAGAQVNTVNSVNGQTGTVVLDPDDLNDSATTNKFTTAGDISKLAGIEAAADVTDAANIAAAIDGATEATTIAGANKFALIVGGALRWISQTNVLATLVATFLTFTNKIAIAATATTGSAFKVIRDLAAASTDSPVVDIVQDNAGDDQAALRVQQDGSGAVIVGYDGATKVFELSDGGTLSVYTVIKALSAAGIQIQDDGGTVAIFVEDGGDVGFGGNVAPSEDIHASANIRADGHFLMNTGVPSGHTETSGFKGLWPGADASFMASSAAGFEGFTLNSNVVRTPSGWQLQNTSNIGWQIFCLWGSSSGKFGITHAPATAGAPSFAFDLVVDSATGYVGFGTNAPQGKAHFHDGTGGFLFVTKTAIDGTAQTIIPNGTGDATRYVRAETIWTDSAGNEGFQANSIAVSSFGDVYSDGGTNVLRMAVAADGSVTIQRIAGSRTYSIATRLLWI